MENTSYQSMGVNMADLLKGGSWANKRTYITGMTGIFGAVGLYLTGAADLPTTFQTIITMVGLMFLRAGIQNNLKKID